MLKVIRMVRAQAALGVSYPIVFQLGPANFVSILQSGTACFEEQCNVIISSVHSVQRHPEDEVI